MPGLAAVLNRVRTHIIRTIKEDIMVIEQRIGVVLVKSIMTCLAMLAIHVCGMFIRLRPAR